MLKCNKNEIRTFNIGMEANEIVRNQILEIIDNQLEANDPPETKMTYDRLEKEGLNDYDIRQLIGQCVAVEIFNIIKFQQVFNQQRFVKNLNALPKSPVE